MSAAAPPPAPPGLLAALPAAHARAVARLRALGLPSPQAPSAVDVLAELRGAGVAASQWLVREGARRLRLRLADV